MCTSFLPMARGGDTPPQAKREAGARQENENDH